MGVASELYRIETKGLDYSLKTWNDAYYYRAMVTDLWKPPSPIGEYYENSQLSDEVRLELSRYYSASSIHSYYLHGENGPARQPPYAYRILLPTIVGSITRVGISIDGAFMIMYCVGLGLLAVFSYLTIRANNISSGNCDYPHVSSVGHTFPIALVLAVAATTNPNLPDALFLGLSMLAVWAASGRRPLAFVIAASLAVLTRETGVILALYWLILAWKQQETRERRPNWRRKARVTALLPAFIPPIVFLLARSIVGIPKNEVNFMMLIETITSGDTFIVAAAGSLVLVCLFAPALVGLGTYTTRKDALVLACAVSYALLTMLIATNTSRMALLVAPVIIGTSTWRVAHSRLWILGMTSAPIAYFTCEQASNRLPQEFGSWLWLLATGCVLLLQVIAARRSDSYRAKPN